MPYPQHLDQFIGQYLDSHGADVARPAYAVLEAVVDGPIKRELGSDYIKLAFDYDACQEHPDAQYVTYGSAFLEKVVQHAVKSHSSTMRYCASKGQVTAFATNQMAEQLQVRPQAVTVGPPKLYFAPCLRFKFKIAYLSDVREEHLFPVWMDGFSGKEMAGYGQETHIFYDAKPEAFRPELPHRPLVALFSTALGALRSQTAARRSELEVQNRAQLMADIERTNAYFEKMIEGNRIKLDRARMESAQEQADSINEKISSVLLQQKHHIKDVEQKYRVRAEVTLLDAAWYMVPRSRLVASAGGRAGKGTSEHVFFWDEVLKRLVT